MSKIALFMLATLLTVNPANSHAADDEPLTLLGTIFKWRYPESKIHKSQMSDAATMDADGKRTVPSTLLKTTLTTPDSAEKVVDELAAQNSAGLAAPLPAASKTLHRIAPQETEALAIRGLRKFLRETDPQA